MVCPPNHMLLTGIRADPLSGSPGWTLNGFDNGRNSAILRYVGAPNADPTTVQATAKAPLIEANLVVRAAPINRPRKITDSGL
jgi:iron transport multicopper oxidase